MRTGTTALALCIASFTGGCASQDSGRESLRFVRPVYARQSIQSVSPQRPALAPASQRASRPVSDLQAAYAVLEPPPAPPAPNREMIAARPAREAVWVQGYHAYIGGGRYAWVPGHWEVPPRHHRMFQPPTWEQRGNGYVYIPGGWR